MRLVTMLTGPAVMTASQVDALVSRLAGYCQDSPISLMYLHGSHAHAKQSALSDLDLAVLLRREAGVTTADTNQLVSDLIEICGREDVDLVVLNTAGVIIRDRVVRFGRLVYAVDQRERLRFETMAIKEALDFAYYSSVYDRALFRQLREGRFLG